MEGLRGAAVFLVFLVHYSSLIHPKMSVSAHDFVDVIHAIGNVGVDLFFVLSGFLIYGSLLSKSWRIRSFLARRVQRIYPAYLVTFVLYVVLFVFLPERSKLPADAVDVFWYLMQNVLLMAPLLEHEPMIVVSWSLTYEMGFYLTMPLLMLGLRWGSIPLLWRHRLLWVFAFLLLVMLVWAGKAERLVMFAAGMLLYERWSGKLALPSIHWVLLLGVLSVVLIIQQPLGYFGTVTKLAVLAVFFMSLCHACFSQTPAWLAGAFSWAPIRWLGNFSYSYYLVHGLALQAAFMLIDQIHIQNQLSMWAYMALMPLCFVATVFPALLLFVLVERPFSIRPSQPPIHDKG